MHYYLTMADQLVTLLLQYPLTSLDLSFDKWIAVNYDTLCTYLMRKHNYFSGRCVLRKKIGGKGGGKKKNVICANTLSALIYTFLYIRRADRQTDRHSDVSFL